MKKISLFSIFGILLLIVGISACIDIERHTHYFVGEELNFRGDLNQANNIDLKYNESELKKLFLDPPNGRIKIAYFNTTEQQGEIPFYTMAAFEFSTKYTRIFKIYAGIQSTNVVNHKKDGTCFLTNSPDEWEKGICIGTVGIQSLDELDEYSNQLVLLFLGPSKAEQTQIKTKQEKLIIQS